MPLTDTTILEWAADFTSRDTNEPTNHELIAQMLDDQVRLIRSVQRAESENKGWVRAGLIATYISATSFSTPGDNRLDAAPGRRVRCTIDSGYKYGTILSSSYGSSITTTTVDWDPEVYTDHAFTPVPDAIAFGLVDLRSRFSTGDRVEFWNLTNGNRMVRKIASVAYLTATVLSFETGDPAIPIDVVDDTVILVKSTGIDNTLSEVELGIMTPDLFQSGWSNSMMGGTFEIEFDGSVGPFATDLPVLQHNGSYSIQVQPRKIVSGTPGSAQWTKPIVTSRLGDSFEVTLPAAIAAGSTVAYDWLIVR